ncbi:SWIM zinc finger family protein [Saccharopolyspora pogona]|uniref:SWIM zinc finger family protein n=1 Tax=Saccharopolyspora pogona TaxID=333966 RepID=UPI001689216C|nr:DUF6880 family protein [Saccharopolyspora pogona]
MAWFTESDLRRLAGERSFDRGLGYQDAVGSIAELPDGVVASVAGTDSYRVRLRDLGGRLGGDCSCPYGREGAFCKHCVAVGLRILAVAPRDAKLAPGSDVRAFLETLDQSELVDLIWQQAQDDPALYQRLRLLAATTSDQPDFSALRDQIDLLQTDWLDYDEAVAYADRTYGTLDALRRLLPDHATDVQSLLREVMTHVGAAAGCGEGEVEEVADAAWQLYLDACEVDPPDPEELGHWLAYFRLNGSDWPSIELCEVIELLGSEGLAAYRLGLDQPGSRCPVWRLRWLREELVRETEDTDTLIKTFAEDLSNPYSYVRIADVLREAGRVDEAIDWLQRGLRDMGRRDPRLVDLLVDLYQAEGRGPDAVELLEAGFADAPDEGTYRRLRGAAERTGQWSQLRERAHQVLRKRVEAGKSFAAATLARILLAEDDIDASWQVVQHYDCDPSTRMAVAERRAETHPADAIAIYRPQVDTAIAETNRQGYLRAAQLLTALRGLHSRIGEREAFAADVRQLKETHRRKRNFLSTLAEHGL